ncbi:ATP-grasp domain-containing protein [Kineosporia sp. NBRC 101731]|uniref:ATP-grasp domain-containing protein n=1 Tax=Kineosporia sp. NBRC 101731 TaxID=3032199 RepID=UPI0024A4151B|nr:ATP-grasp domain-containing protein [Kineosporia sp. NBRC 101731]GLY30468.1 hypothetical protein Kisp02_38330 [Kineosporia sp. NBRC 101731]
MLASRSPGPDDAGGPAVIVDPYSSGALLAGEFRAAGVPVVAVLTAPQPPSVFAGTYRPDDFVDNIYSSGDDFDLTAQLRRWRPRCVLAGCDTGVELADTLAAELLPDLAHDPRLAFARRHKGRMAGALAAAGVAVPRQITSNSIDEVEKWWTASGLEGSDLVVKPPEGAGTDSVNRVAAGTDWRPVFTGLLGTVNQVGIVNETVLVQEHLTGPEYVIDTVSLDGRHSIASAGRYRKADNGPYMAVYDFMEWLPPDAPEAEEVFGYTRSVLDALGYRYGPGHAEVMRTPAGCRLIEVAARPHGSEHSHLCRVANGDSQIDRLVRYFTGGGPAPDGYVLQRPMRIVFLRARGTGILGNTRVMSGLRDLKSFHAGGLRVQDGARVETTRGLFQSLDIGVVVLSSPDAAQVEADYETVRELEGRLRIAA